MLSQLNNLDLDFKIKSLAQEERELLCETLQYIKEADTRRLYLDLAYPSLFSYLIDACRYSPGAAQRRIDAVRLMEIEPNLAQKIESGEVNLSQLTLVQKGFREKSKTVQISDKEKLDLIAQLGNKTTAETQLLIAQELDLEIKELTKETQQKDESVRLEITLSKEQWQKLKKARALASNVTQSNDWATLFEYLSDKLIKQKESPRYSKSTATVAVRKSTHQDTRTSDSLAKSGTSKEKKAVRQATKKSVLCRDQACQYKDHKTGKICASRWNLHVDHIQPLWAGGSNSIENLRILCAEHNHHNYRQQAQIKMISS